MLSFRNAALNANNLAASTLVAISAIIHWIAWNFEIGCPNCTLVFAYSMESSNAPLAIPIAWAAIPILPPSKVDKATLKPSPTSPSWFFFGILASSKINSAVDEPLIPSLSSNFPTLNPGVLSKSTIKATIPLCFLDLSVWAINTQVFASPPFVMNNFVPLTIHSSPTNFAVVEIFAASDPALGSVNPRQPNFSPFAIGVKYSFFCSSVPYLKIGSQAKELLTDIMTPVEAQYLLTASNANT